MRQLRMKKTGKKGARKALWPLKSSHRRANMVRKFLGKKGKKVKKMSKGKKARKEKKKLAKAEKRPLSPEGAAEKAIKKAKNTAMERAYKGKTLIVPRKKHKWSKKKLSPADP